MTTISKQEIARLRAIEVAARIIVCGSAAAPMLDKLPALAAALDMPGRAPSLTSLPCVCLTGCRPMIALPANVFCREREVERFEEYQAAQERAAEPEPADMTEDSEEWQRYLKRRGSQPMPE